MDNITPLELTRNDLLALAFLLNRLMPEGLERDKWLESRGAAPITIEKANELLERILIGIDFLDKTKAKEDTLYCATASVYNYAVGLGATEILDDLRLQDVKSDKTITLDHSDLFLLTVILSEFNQLMPDELKRGKKIESKAKTELFEKVNNLIPKLADILDELDSKHLDQAVFTLANKIEDD